MNSHVDKVRAYMEMCQLDALLISSKEMRRYLGTLDGDGCQVILTLVGGYLLFDGRYRKEAHEHEHTLGLREHVQGISNIEFAGEVLGEYGYSLVGIETSEITVPEYRLLERMGMHVTLLGSEFAQLRSHKDDEELRAIQHAVDATDMVYSCVLEEIQPGMTEREISALIHYYCVAAGADQMATDTIVTSGTRTALPFARPSDRKLEDHEPLLINFGVQLAGYQSTMTRVSFLGKPSDELRRVYSTVHDAYCAACGVIRPGALGKDVEAAACDVVQRAGFGEYAAHSLGHGIGLGNDYPLINALSETKLDNRMVMSCGPGVYVPGVGGVCLEDDIALLDGLPQTLSHTSQDMRVLEIH